MTSEAERRIQPLLKFLLTGAASHRATNAESESGSSGSSASAETESELYRDVVAAVEAGELTLLPDGSFSPPDRDLTLGEQIAALRAMGLPIAPVDRVLTRHAQTMMNVLSVVAGSNEAPAEYVEIAEALTGTLIGAGGQQGEPWMFALEAIMGQHAPDEDGGGAAPDGAAVLEALRFMLPVSMIPKQLRDPDPERLEKATATLSAMRVRREGKIGGGLHSPWAAARNFANALGCGSMPEVKSKAKRARKSDAD